MIQLGATKYTRMQAAKGIASVLLQEEDEGLRPVFYDRRLCSDAESRYSSYALEVLAITESLERFRINLIGSEIVVVTDCNAVATLKESTALQPPIARWWLRLQEFDFKCKHRPGEQMTHVDGMSRNPVHPPEDKIITVADDVLKIVPIDEDWIYTMQMQEVFANKDASNQWSQFKTDYVICNSRLYRKTDNGNKLGVPQAIRWRVTKCNHDEAGHFGTEKTLERLKKYFGFPRTRGYIKSYIASCPECCVNKVKGGKSEGELYLQEVVPIPFRTINIDHFGPFIRSKTGNCHILVVVCAFTKYSFLIPTRNTKTTPVIKALKQIFCVFGQPVRLISDRGTSFTSKEFEHFINENGIQHIKTAVRTPRANGQAERINETLLSALKTNTANDKDWDQNLGTNINSTTKFTPNDLVFNFNVRDVSKNRSVQA